MKRRRGVRDTQVYRRAAEKSALIREAAEPFDEIKSSALDALLERIGDARVVLIGEATHGTREFYLMRQQITRALIERKDFEIIGTEADWPDAEYVDEYVRIREGKPDRAWDAFTRFPTWMWRNREVLQFVEWLRSHNEARDPEKRTGYYGLDLYSLYTSVHEVLSYLRKVDQDLERMAAERYACLAPFSGDPALYGRAVTSERYEACEDDVTNLLTSLLRKRLDLMEKDGERFFDAAQNAHLVASAERYYRTMYYGSVKSWNLRDTHMFETLVRIMDFRGEGSKAVVWAHNSHLGDAAATEMSARGEINLGHLCRATYGDDAYLIGFGTHTGTVAAADSWGGEVAVKQLRPSRPDSYEHLFHHSGIPRLMLPLREPPHAEVRGELGEELRQRAIGVIYRPETELQSHYFKAVLPEQFDEYIWFDESSAVRPLDHATAPDLPERHPFLLID